MYRQFFDISVPLHRDTLIYPGDPPFSQKRLCEPEQGDAFRLSEFHFSAHTGTHLDAPSHFLPAGKSIAEYDAANFVLPAVVHQSPAALEISAEELDELSLEPKTALLFKTPNSERGIVRRQPFRDDFVSLSLPAAQLCVQKQLALVGIDYLSVEKDTGGDFPVHHLLLENNVLILEGIDLAEVEPGQYTLFCFPLKIENAEASPVRAVLAR